MAGNYSHVFRIGNTILTAAQYNTDHQNHIDFQTPAGYDDNSVSVAQMRAENDPGELGTESQAATFAEELERLHFAIRESGGKTFWYQTPPVSIASVLTAIGGLPLNDQFIKATQVFGRRVTNSGAI